MSNLDEAIKYDNASMVKCTAYFFGHTIGMIAVASFVGYTLHFACNYVLGLF
jgi:hypothetical protein